MASSACRLYMTFWGYVHVYLWPIWAAGAVFTGYYSNNPPGVYFSMAMLLPLLWALLKAGMVSDIFSVLGASVAHKIVVSVSVIQLSVVISYYSTPYPDDGRTCCVFPYVKLPINSSMHKSKWAPSSSLPAWSWVRVGPLQLCERKASRGSCTPTDAAHVQGTSVPKHFNSHANPCNFSVHTEQLILSVMSIDGRRRSWTEFGLPWLCKKHIWSPADGLSKLCVWQVSGPTTWSGRAPS